MTRSLKTLPLLMTLWLVSAPVSGYTQDSAPAPPDESALMLSLEKELAVTTMERDEMRGARDEGRDERDALREQVRRDAYAAGKVHAEYEATLRAMRRRHRMALGVSIALSLLVGGGVVALVN